VVGWVNQKLASAIFHYLSSEGRKIIKFVHGDQGGFAPAIVYLQRPFGLHDRLPDAIRFILASTIAAAPLVLPAAATVARIN
jgi:hypothetical protein